MADRTDDTDADEGLDALRHHDDWYETRTALQRLAGLVDEWAGMPMPINDQELVIEPTYPFAKVLEEMGRKANAPEPDLPRVIERNKFYSHRWRTTIIVYEFEGGQGKVTFTASSPIDNVFFQLQTIGASYAWGIEQEANALMTLADMIPHHAFKKYLLTGMFLESSKRSGVMYVFRKLRPTIALTLRDKETDRARVLCTLCLHPIGYYAGTWAGAMCPTDDVIAHLAMMRGDEHFFWKKCNQHPRDRPESGF